MFELDNQEILFVLTAFLFQAVLIAHFAMRKWYFNLAMRYGWIVYALGIPAAAVSGLLLLGNKTWWLWIGGFIYLVWAMFGYVVEYVQGIAWRNPPRWPVFGPYVTLYLATILFYWWPVGLLYRPLWYVYTTLFVVSTALNLTSHTGQPAHTSESLPEHKLN